MNEVEWFFDEVDALSSGMTRKRLSPSERGEMNARILKFKMQALKLVRLHPEQMFVIWISIYLLDKIYEDVLEAEWLPVRDRAAREFQKPIEETFS